MSSVDKLLLKKAPNGTTTSLRFGVYMAVSGAPQVSHTHTHTHSTHRTHVCAHV